MMHLPKAFIEQMKLQLGSGAEAFLQSYDLPRVQGLRLNPGKINVNNGFAIEPIVQKFSLEPVPWCSTGFYYREDTKPGKHPYHAAGLYYIQEPSAMSAVELLDPRPGEIVLDLAAAPGGKSTQIAGKLSGQGLLISNEIHAARAKILSENMERMGVRNSVVVSASPHQLADRFPRFFDKVMVDAPCSGEGMFRKDPDAISEWSPAHVEMCAARQADIMQAAVTMLKPGGRIAYSTCTFNELENERTVEALLLRYPQLQLERVERIWPHLQAGEGHFVAVLRLTADLDSSASTASGARRSSQRGGRRQRPEEEAMRLFHGFAAEALNQEHFELPPGEPLLFGEQLYWLPSAQGCLFDSSWLQSMKVLRPGLHLGEVKKGRLEPAHALALALPSALAVRYAADFPSDSEEIQRYLKGEVLERQASGNGWTLVTVDGYPLGWGKQTGHQLKNHFPKGLRR